MRVAYVLQRFPYLTETFVAEEIAAVLRRGAEVRILSLFAPGPGVVQAQSKPLLERAVYADQGSVVAGILRALREPASRSEVSSMIRERALTAKSAVVAARSLATLPELMSWQPDLVHAHFAWLPGAAARLLARSMGVPYTVTAHAYDIYRSSELLPWIASGGGTMVPISEYNRAAIEALVPTARQSVIHCGVDVSRLEREIEQAQNSTATVDGPPRIVAVGSLVEKKGHEFLIRATAELKSAGVAIEVHIVGAGPLERQLRELTIQLGVEGSVRLMGALPHAEIVRELVAADVFALACVVAADGDRDGIPVAMMEAALAGLPIVSTEVSGIPELVRHDDTGLLVPPGDSRALAGVMQELVGQPELRRRLGGRARRLVLAEYSVDANAERLMALWEELLRTRPLEAR